MAYVIVKHRAKDLSHRIFVDSDDENHIFGFFEYESVEKARKFFDSDELKQKMKEAGVVEVEGIYYLDER